MLHGCNYMYNMCNLNTLILEQVMTKNKDLTNAEVKQSKDNAIYHIL